MTATAKYNRTTKREIGDHTKQSVKREPLQEREENKEREKERIREGKIKERKIRIEKKRRRRKEGKSPDDYAGMYRIVLSYIAAVN